MLFPETAKNAIAKIFYDKTVVILEKVEKIDKEGGVTKSFAEKSRFFANVRFNALGAIQTELGLTENIDVALTCAAEISAKAGDVLEYDNAKYLVMDAVPYDSHKLIVGKKWQGQ